MLSPAETPELDHPGSIIYYNVPDVVATHAAMQARGVKFREGPHAVHKAGPRELWMAFLDDTEGNTLAIMEWKTAAVSSEQ
jgi:methylmalonyl-CoA/ethylmalonyl-CoA epimerase